MKDWNMIHKIKSLFDNGNGLSRRKIAEQLKISRGTVKKYLSMTEDEIATHLTDRNRDKQLDPYKDYILHLLQTWPDLSAQKVYQKLTIRQPELVTSTRSVRRYVESLKETHTLSQKRYYEPVLDMIPGEQCQVDGGELRNVRIDGIERIVYFVVFVLSYSRLMYVSASLSPINTLKMIQMHDETFRYFGGVPEECVYDQAKVVIINEEFRELTLNEAFSQFASAAEFRIHGCEGYDPESKGKVESGVKYVKGNFFAGETFHNQQHLQEALQNWLDTTANCRLHGTTGQLPRELFELQEKAHLKPYRVQRIAQSLLSPELSMTRKVDKTSLISYKANKYSVPQQWQSSTVMIDDCNGQLIIYRLDDHQEIARHNLSYEKGKIIKNNNHYRDNELQLQVYEKKISDLIGESQAQSICSLLRQNYPKIYRDQLRATLKLFEQYLPQVDQEQLIDRLCQLHSLSATSIRDYLQAWQHQPERFKSSKQACFLNKASVISALTPYNQLVCQSYGGTEQ